MEKINPVIVYRNDIDWKHEAAAAKKYFTCHHSRVLVKPNDLVIPRFSALPFFKEQEEDYKLLGAKMINSYQDHIYIADIQNWHYDLYEYTPRTFYRLEDIPSDAGPFVLKGETNSKKFQWDKMMYAKDKSEAIRIAGLLMNDSLLQYQKIVAREYIPLETFKIGIGGLPITREYRFFVYKDRILSGGYYWSSHVDELDFKPDPDEVPREFLNEVIDIVKDKTNFYVIDVAKTQDGQWIVIELNDGSMSGLSENDPEVLYSNLKKALDDGI